MVRRPAHLELRGARGTFPATPPQQRDPCRWGDCAEVSSAGTLYCAQTSRISWASVATTQTSSYAAAYYALIYADHHWHAAQQPERFPGKACGAQSGGNDCQDGHLTAAQRTRLQQDSRQLRYENSQAKANSVSAFKYVSSSLRNQDLMHNIWWWVGFNALVLGLLALDLGVFHRESKAVSVKEALGVERGMDFSRHRLWHRYRLCHGPAIRAWSFSRAIWSKRRCPWTTSSCSS